MTFKKLALYLALLVLLALGIKGLQMYFGDQDSVPTTENRAAVLGAFATQDLVAHYPFDNLSTPSSGGFILSSNYEPTVSGVDLVSGIIGSAYSLNASSSVKVDRPVQDDFSICAWIKPERKGIGPTHYESRAIAASSWPGSGNDYTFGVNGSGVLVLGIGSGTGSDTSVYGKKNLVDASWHYVCATRNKTSGEIKVYSDAVLESTATAPTASLTTNPKLLIGDRSDGQKAPFIGVMDDMRIYSRVLTIDEITELYNYRGETSTPPDTSSNTTTTTNTTNTTTNTSNTTSSNTNTQATTTTSTQTTPTATSTSPVVVSATTTTVSQPLPVINTPSVSYSSITENYPASGNGVVLKNFSTVDANNKTFTVSRIFAKGEILNYPKARIGGSPTETQADVMSRYEDGSVKHAMISFVADVPNNGSTAVDFINQSSCNCGVGLALTKDQMLASGYDFEAVIETSKDGNTQKASAREMLQNGDFRYWLKGPIVTQIILEDRSTALKYDFGYKNTASFLATPNGYFRAGDTSMNVLDASDIPVPSVIKLFNERMRVCGKTGNTIQFGVSSCPNYDGRKYGGTTEVGIAAWGEFATVEDQTGWRPADTSTFKSMHPIFVATFTPKSPESTKVDMILENMWTQKLQDQFYDLVLKIGRGLTPVYSKANIKHIAKTRWRKTFSIGAQPPAVYIDYNLPYLAYTKAIPNFNPDLNITNSAITSMLDTGYYHSVGTTPGWRNSDKGEPGTNDSSAVQGQIWKNQFDAGQRPDIGLFTTWQMVYLYAMKTSDSRVPELFQELVGNGNASNMIPMFARESKTGKLFVTGMSDDMFGRSMSLDARPKTYSNISKSSDQDGDYQFAVDKTSNVGWIVDVNHFPNSFYLPYLFTGDWYFLEGMYNEASYILHTTNPNNRIFGKGLIGNEDRGVAWSFRGLGEAAFLAPDSTPEKKYYTDKMINNIAVREGSFDIQNGSYYSPCTTNPFNAYTETSIWCIGKNKFGKFPNALNFWSKGYGADGEADLTKANNVSIPFQNAFLHVVLGHLDELGFTQIRPLRERFAQNLLGQVFDPTYSPYFLQNYRTPSTDKNGNYFQTWAEVKNAMLSQYQTRTTDFVNDHDYEGGYSILSYGASSFLTNFSWNGISGQTAWDWFKSHIDYQDRFNGSPKWAFLPRTGTIATTTVPNPTNPPTNTAPTVTLSANPTSVDQGNSVTLSWSSTNASSCSASWTNQTSTSGSASVAPTANTTYNISCSGNGGSASASASVAVNAVTPPVSALTPVFLSNPTIDPEYKSASVAVHLDSQAVVKAEWSTDQSFTSSTTFSFVYAKDHVIDLRGLQPGKSYNLRVRARASGGGEAVSVVVPFSTLQRPSKPPKILNVTASEGSVILKWDKIDYELCANIKVYRSETGFITVPEETSLVASLACSELGYHDEAVKPLTKYYYSIFLKDEYGDYSDPVTVSFTTNAEGNSGTASSGSGGGGGGGGGTTVVTTTSSSGGGSSGGGGSSSGRTTATITAPTSTATVPGNAVGIGVVLSRTLAYGMEGKDVTDLQNFLISKGYLAPGNAIGFFGRLTEAAVKSFQRAEGIVSSGSAATTGYGLAGAKTRARIAILSVGSGQSSSSSGSVTTASGGVTSATGGVNLSRNLSYGSQGADVTVLQNFLISKGYLAPGNAIGFFGRLTEAAVKSFQRAEGIVSSGSPQTTGYGNVGPGTRARIKSLSSQ